MDTESNGSDDLSKDIIHKLQSASFSPSQASQILEAVPNIRNSVKGFHSRLSQFKFLVKEGVYDQATAHDFVCSQPKFFDWDLEVVHENEHYIAINKPFNVRLNSGTKREKLWEDEVTVSDWLDKHYPELEKHYLCHQLDMATSGILLIAKSHKAASKAQKMFLKRQVKKRYSAIVYGHPSWDTLTVDAPIGKDPNHEFKMKVPNEGEDGKDSQTYIEVIKRGYLRCSTNRVQEALKEVSLVSLFPQTGRRHQLRVHSKWVGHPIVGDATYSSDLTNFRMFLHAEALALPLHLNIGGHLNIVRKSNFGEFVN